MEEEAQQVDPTRLLPDDVLADILRRAAPGGLAASRCVCRAWRALIDARRLLLPHSLAGLVVRYGDETLTDVFARPSAPKLTGYRRLDGIRDHCNGLLLYYDGVLNPATDRLVPLPEHPPPRSGMSHYLQSEYLVFDPTASMRFEVFLIPRLTEEEDDPPPQFWARHLLLPGLKELPFYKCSSCEADHVDDAAATSDLGPEWPPSPFILNVFSSTTRRWEERSFDREGESAGTVADLKAAPSYAQRRYGVCWQGALYVHSEGDSVTRISLSDNRYRVIAPPRGSIELCEFPDLRLGKSEKGVYCALIDDDRRLRVWTLDESCDQIEWILKHSSTCHLAPASGPNCTSVQQAHGPWSLLKHYKKSDGNGGTPEERSKFEWDSDEDDDDILCNNGDRAKEPSDVYHEILGFHPYKEIVFLHRKLERGLAFHLNSSKLEDLGDFYPYTALLYHTTYVRSCFPYTPCWA